MSPCLLNILKPVSLLVIVGLLSACGGEEIDFRQLHTIQGLFYKANAKEPFTGTVTNMPLQYSITCKVEIEDGLKNGLEACHYGEGGKFSETVYVKGIKHGDDKRWLTDGFQYADLHWVNGQPDGLNKMWDTKKQLVSEVEFSKGYKSGIEKLWRDGVLEYDTVWRDGTRSGTYFWNGYYNKITNGVFSPLLKVGTNEPYVKEESKSRIVEDDSSTTGEKCVLERIDAINQESKDSGEEIVISRDMLAEFEEECGS